MKSYIPFNGLPQTGCVGAGLGFLEWRKRKWGTKGAPERRLGEHSPDMMKGRKKQHVYNPSHGGEQLILTQKGGAGVPEGLALGGCAI